MKGPVLNLIYVISVPLACSAGVFFGRANVLLAKAPCWNSRLRRESGASIFLPSPSPLSFFHPSTYPKGYYFYSLFIFLHHNIKDCGYNSTNTNKQLSPAQNRPSVPPAICFRNTGKFCLWNPESREFFAVETEIASFAIRNSIGFFTYLTRLLLSNLLDTYNFTC